MSLMQWSDSQIAVPDVELDNVLQQYIVELQGSGAPVSQSSTAIVDPLWLGSSNQIPASVDIHQSPYAVPAGQQLQSGETEQLFPTNLQCQEPVDDMHHNSSGADLRGCEGNTGSSSSKRTEAWTAKNRRAQKKFREKQKAWLSCVATTSTCCAICPEELAVHTCTT